MDAGKLFLLFWLIAPLAIFAGAAYGDYKAEGKWPWSKKKDSTNSGAKFG